MSSKSDAWLKANYRLILVLVLLIAAVLRIFGLNNLSPPGLEHDEVAHWLISKDILEGNHAVYFTEAYGHEAGYHYFQTISIVLLGGNVFALRLPSAFAGLLLVAISFALARRLFGLKMAILSAALLAFLFWPVFYSRLALRAISLPVLTGLSAYFWWKGWQLGQRIVDTSKRASRENEGGGQTLSYRISRNPNVWYVVAGLLAGLSFYTYMASRVVPIFYLLFAIYLALFHRPGFKKHWQGILYFFLVYALVAAPLALFLLSNPGAEARINEVNEPLMALSAGDIKPVVQNTMKFLAMFGISGDPLWRQNVANLPVFEPLLALFFYIGLVISIWRWREPRYLFIVLWLFTAAIPSIVTIDAPSHIRIINALPVVTLFPVIGLQVIHFFRPLSTVYTKLSPKMRGTAVLIALFVVLAFYIARTTNATFKIWPSSVEVQFVWQKALTDVAGFIDATQESNAVAVGGWTPETMDPPTMDLTLQGNDFKLRYFDPTQSLILPASQNGEPGRIFRPAALPLDPYLAGLLIRWSAGSHIIDSFIYYDVPGRPVIQPHFPADESFGDEITFLGYDRLLSSGNDIQSDALDSQAGPVRLVTYWQVDKPVGDTRRVFIHALDESGQIIAQDDSLGVPAAHWQADDIFIQIHTLDIPPAEGPVFLRLGMYNPETGERLLTTAHEEFYLIE